MLLGIWILSKLLEMLRSRLLRVPKFSITHKWAQALLGRGQSHLHRDLEIQRNIASVSSVSLRLLGGCTGR